MWPSWRGHTSPCAEVAEESTTSQRFRTKASVLLANFNSLPILCLNQWEKWWENRISSLQEHFGRSIRIWWFFSEMDRRDRSNLGLWLFDLDCGPGWNICECWTLGSPVKTWLSLISFRAFVGLFVFDVKRFQKMDAINLPTTSNNMPHSGTLEMPCGRLCHLLPRRLRVCHGLSENLGLGFPKNLMINHYVPYSNGHKRVYGHKWAYIIHPYSSIVVCRNWPDADSLICLSREKEVWWGWQAANTQHRGLPPLSRRQLASCCSYSHSHSTTRTCYSPQIEVSSNLGYPQIILNETMAEYWNPWWLGVPLALF